MPTDSEILKTSDENLLVDMEAEIQTFVVSQAEKLKKILSISKLLTNFPQSDIVLPEAAWISPPTPLTRFYLASVRPVLLAATWVVAFSCSVVIIGGLVLNGFDFPRSFLRSFLQSLSLPTFLVVFNVYLGYFAYLIVHGVSESRLQGFKGIHWGRLTDTQSLLYWTR